MKFIKNFIKNLLPIFLYNIIKKSLTKEKFTFVKKFSSFYEAQNFSKTDYISEELEKAKTQTFHNLESFEFDNKHNLIPIIFSILENENSILEIGAGDNPAHLYLKKANIHKNIFSSIIEKESFVKKFEKKIPLEYLNQIEYKYTVKDIKQKQYDVAYFGSSIQYIEDHEEFLIDIFQLKPKLLVISRTHFNTSDEDFFVIQANIENSLFPYKMISLKRLIKFLKLNSYNLIYNVELSKFHKHEYLNNITYRDLIFKKI